jgi:peptidoglycan hydrolase-like protein with peptidoglycan-binding domain
VTPSWYTRDLAVGDQGEDVRTVQLLLRCEPTGVYDDNTRAKVRGYQTLRQIQTGRSGRVDEVTAIHLGELR